MVAPRVVTTTYTAGGALRLNAAQGTTTGRTPAMADVRSS